MSVYSCLFFQYVSHAVWVGVLSNESYRCLGNPVPQLVRERCVRKDCGHVEQRLSLRLDHLLDKKRPNLAVGNLRKAQKVVPKYLPLFFWTHFSNPPHHTALKTDIF